MMWTTLCIILFITDVSCFSALIVYHNMCKLLIYKVGFINVTNHISFFLLAAIISVYFEHVQLYSSIYLYSVSTQSLIISSHLTDIAKKLLSATGEIKMLYIADIKYCLMAAFPQS